MSTTFFIKLYRVFIRLFLTKFNRKCWVHCRRKFDEALKAVPKAAQKESLSYLIIKQIQAIYREEDKLKELKPEDRLKQRQVVIKPLVDALFAYLKSNERKASIAEIAKANNLKPYEYFKYLLTEIPAHMDDADHSFLEDLLPWSPKLPEYIRKQKDC